MRIVAGTHKGKSITAPSGQTLRPTSDRAREGIFNSLCHGNSKIGIGDHVTNSWVLDGFSGTGAMAFEALSRGAKYATCLDSSQISIECCRTNATSLGFSKNLTITQCDVLSPPVSNKPCCLIFLDPPYFKDLIEKSLISLATTGWIQDKALCITETAQKEKIQWPPSFRLLDQRKYGKSLITFLRFTDRVSVESS